MKTAMTQITPTAFSVHTQAHHHSVCLRRALESAQRLCRVRGVKLTATRQKILEMIWACHQPVGAYHLLDRLAQEGKKAAPPTVYRALDFLVTQGLIHRIESLNAYVGCPHPETQHMSLFLICRVCHTVAEIHDHPLFQRLLDAMTENGFAPEQQVLEIHGLCPLCQTGGRDDN